MIISLINNTHFLHYDYLEKIILQRAIQWETFFFYKLFTIMVSHVILLCHVS